MTLSGRLAQTIERLNSDLPREAREDAARKIKQVEYPDLVEENRCLHRYLIEGVPVEVAQEDGSIGEDVARLIDFADVDANDWLAVNQYTVIERQRNRRPDVVLFVNVLPLAVVELKNPGDGNATLEGAFNQLQTYKDQIPSLFRTNAVLVTLDGLQTSLGSLTAHFERFMPWRTVDGSAAAPKGEPELGTVIEGVFEKSRFLALTRELTVFGDTGSGLVSWPGITSSTPCAMRSRTCSPLYTPRVTVASASSGTPRVPARAYSWPSMPGRLSPIRP